MNNEKYLPIGTVVLLKGAEKRLMIIGYCPIQKSDDKTVYDYSGCLYPEGLINSEEIALFNHDQIDKVFYLGPNDQEGNEFISKVKELMSNVNMDNKDFDFAKYEKDE